MQSYNQTIQNSLEAEKWPVFKWLHFASFIHFFQAVILFLLSFLLFIVKRTYGVDSYQVSGAYDGTTQLTYFIVMNILAFICLLMGFYILRYSKESANMNVTSEFLTKYFKVSGLASIPVFCLLVGGIFYVVLR